MRHVLSVTLLLLMLSVSASSQNTPDILTSRQPDPRACCYELRLENAHTPQSALNHLQLRIITPLVHFQAGAPGPWPGTESDTLILYGESGTMLPTGESVDGFIICVDYPTGLSGPFKIEWITLLNSTVVTIDTITLDCNTAPPACDSLKVIGITPSNQPDESCCYEFTLQNKHVPTSELSGLQLSVVTAGATVVGEPTGPWNGRIVDPTTVLFETSETGLSSGGQLTGLRVCIRPPGGVTGGLLLRWTSFLSGNLICEDIINLACTPKVVPRRDSIGMTKGSDCTVTLSVFNKHRPRSNLDGIRVSILTTGASIETAAPPSGWTIPSQTGLNLTFRKASGTLAPDDSAGGFLMKFKPSSSGLVKFLVCTMLQNGTLGCDTLQVQCDPPPPSTCDSVFTVRTGTECAYDFGFVNVHQPPSAVNDFHIRLQSLGASIVTAVPPAGWKIERRTATEIEFKDTTGVVQAGGRQTGFLLTLQAGAGVQIIYQWCTSFDGSILCCEYGDVTCEQIQSRCDSLAVAPLGDYCSYRLDVGNTHLPGSDFNDFHVTLSDPATVLLDATPPAGWEIDSLNESGVHFSKSQGGVATGEAAEGFTLSLVPSALSNRIPLDWCTSLDGQTICCDTVSVFCAFKIVTLDKVDAITNTERPCCFEFSVDNIHLPRSPLTTFSAEIITPGVSLYGSTIETPANWTQVSNERKVTWRSTTSEIPSGGSQRGFIVCYDNDATGNADFQVAWQTVSSGLIVSEDTLTIKCDRTLGVERIEGPVPGEIRLYQNYPNPFNPATTIRFELPAESDVELSLFDAHGRLVMDLGSGKYDAGNWMLRLDASALPSGVYYYRLRTGSTALYRSMIVLR